MFPCPRPRRLPALARAFLVLLAATIGVAAGQSTVTIESVDNYAGNSNVYTDRPNTTIRVTELDADKKPVRSWVGTTDSSGKLTIQAGSTLSKPYLRAELASERLPLELVAPSEVWDGEPFLFTASGTLSGDVVTVETLDGVVVREARPDRLGRVALAAGLPAGAYLVSSGSRGAGSLEVKPKPSDGLLRPGQPPVEPLPGLSLAPLPSAHPRVEPLSLRGSGFSIEPDDLRVSVAERAVLVLAATPRELQTEPLGDLPAGPARVVVTERGSGVRVAADTFLYQLSARLERERLRNHDTTFVVFTLEPASARARVQATVARGPVQFEGGLPFAQLEIEGGEGRLPLRSSRAGVGDFRLSWQLESIEDGAVPSKAGARR